MDPYVKIHAGSKVFRSKTHTDAGKYPNWHDVFEFQRTNEEILYIYVYDEDVGKSDDLVGSGTLDLNAVCNSMTKTFSDYIKLEYKGKAAGDLYLEVMFQPNTVTTGVSYGAAYAPQTAYSMPQPTAAYPTYVPSAAPAYGTAPPPAAGCKLFSMSFSD